MSRTISGKYESNYSQLVGDGTGVLISGRVGQRGSDKYEKKFTFVGKIFS